MKHVAFAGSGINQNEVQRKSKCANDIDSSCENLSSIAGLVLGLEEKFIAKYDTPLLSCEGRMLAYVLSHDNVSIKELMVNTPVSSRTFFQRLKSLRKNGILLEATAVNDRRVKTLTVAVGVIHD